jgi:hypothetical protein
MTYFGYNSYREEFESGNNTTTSLKLWLKMRINMKLAELFFANRLFALHQFDMTNNID